MNSVFLLLLLVTATAGNCPPESLAPLPFVLEYAIWRGWQQAIVYTPYVESACEWAKIRLIKCLSLNGIGCASDTTQVLHVRSRLGIIVLSTHSGRDNATLLLKNLITKLHQLQMDTVSYDWLIVTNSDQDYSNLNKILNATAVRFDQNLVIAYPHYKNHLEKRLSGLCDNNFAYKSIIKPKFTPRKLYCEDEKKGGCMISNKIAKTHFERNYYRSTDRFRNLTKNHTYLREGKVLPLFNSGFINYNFSRNFLMTNSSKFSLTLQFRKFQRTNAVVQYTRSTQFHVVQYFKVRINSTLYARFLGKNLIRLEIIHRYTLDFDYRHEIMTTRFSLTNVSKHVLFMDKRDIDVSQL